MRADPAYLVATHGDDVAILPGQAWAKQTLTSQLEWHVFDDRQLYRPGEIATIKGWMRLVDRNRGGDLRAPKGVTGVSYRVTDAEDVEIGKGTAKVNALGGFDFQVKLPATPNLGYASIHLTSQGIVGETEHELQIEEFRRPDFDASAHVGPDPIVAGGGGDVTVDAHYFAGGPLGGAKVRWTLHGSATTYAPPHREDYIFGVWKPWWHVMWEDTRSSEPATFDFSSVTDGGGEHVLHVVPKTVPEPYSVAATATVVDSNSQSWSASTTFTVHPASLYVGVHEDKPFAHAGEPMILKLIGVDIDGKAVAGAKITVDVTRHVTEWTNGKAKESDVEPQHCAVVSAQDAVPCTIQSPVGGTYIVRASITDPQGRVAKTELRYYVEGEAPMIRDSSVAQQTIELVPDKHEYAAGNTAELLVRAPFAPAEGIVTLRRSGIIEVRPLKLATASTVITVPITDALVPNVEVQVDLVGAVGKRPAYAVGTTSLAIPPKQRTLAVTVKPSVEKAAPGEKLTIGVDVKDASGAVVANADVAVIAVDDSVLTLAGYDPADPLGTFYGTRESETSSYYARSFVQLPREPVPTNGNETPDKPRPSTGRYGTIGHGNGTGSGYGVGSGRGGGGLKRKMVIEQKLERLGVATTKDIEAADPSMSAQAVAAGAADRDADGILDKTDVMPDATIAVRSNFDPLAVFAGSVATDANGHATVPVTLPDNLTRYRLIAIAAAGDTKFGKGEATLTARLPLMVRATPPRFLSFGDTFQLPISLQNQTDAAMTVQVAARGTNLTVDGKGREVTVPANDHVLVEIPASAASAGTARVQIVATAGTASDAQELSLPVWTPATGEAFATYGTIDDKPITQPFSIPANALPGFGGVEISFASTNLQALTDALIYLVRYPYECSEQRSSRILAIAGLRDVLTAFHAKDLPAPDKLAKSVATDIEWIAKLQGDDGGFSYWKQTDPSDPYVSVYVTHAMAVAKAKGYPVPAPLFEKAKEYLKDIGERIPTPWGPDERLSIEAFALSVRAELGDVDLARATALAQTKDLPIDAAAWLLGVLAGKPQAVELEKYLQAQVREQAGAASIGDKHENGWRFLASDGRTAALVLDAMIRDQPKLDLIPKLVTGLLAGKKRGHWLSTQEDAFVLTALDHYFHTYEKVTPNFIARAWLGTDYAGDHAFRGRTTETDTIAVAMADAMSHHDVTIAKEGAGRLYYRIGASYAPSDLKIQPADHGFAVTRRYEAVDNKQDVALKNGVWHVKVGARVRVVLEMAADGDRYHVALVDPLPAGFEAINPELAGAQTDDTDIKSWRGMWWDHQNLRDERVESFVAELPNGVYALDYIARATVRGSFVAAPTKAEEMYMPETFGRAASETVIVE
ncbi:MAG: alpha-2-macroglobulin family protein [Kofleriaceae bacterium]